MTPQQIYMRALGRMRSRIAAMERNLNGASLSVHEEFEELCLIVTLLDQFSRNGSHAPITTERVTSHLEHTALPPVHHNGQQTEAHPIYVIIDIEMRDPDAFIASVDDHQDVVERYGGRFLIARSTCEVIEGNWRPKRIVVQRWPSAEAFHRWYDSGDGATWKALPTRTITNLVLVETLENEALVIDET